MNLYTGYFAKVQSYSENDLVVCSIAQYDPSWFTGLSIKQLSPDKTLLSRYKANEISFGFFAKEFLGYLETVDFEPIFEQLEQICDDYSGVVLCCYEKPNQFCHRHLVASYLNSHYQLGVKEI